MLLCYAFSIDMYFYNFRHALRRTAREEWEEHHRSNWTPYSQENSISLLSVYILYASVNDNNSSMH